jgi:hypothetical protein
VRELAHFTYRKNTQTHKDTASSTKMENLASLNGQKATLSTPKSHFAVPKKPLFKMRFLSFCNEAAVAQLG